MTREETRVVRNLMMWSALGSDTNTEGVDDLDSKMDEREDFEAIEDDEDDVEESKSGVGSE